MKIFFIEHTEDYLNVFVWVAPGSHRLLFLIIVDRFGGLLLRGSIGHLSCLYNKAMIRKRRNQKEIPTPKTEEGKN